LSGKVLAELNVFPSLIDSASFSPDGQCIVTTSSDKTVRVWDLSGKVLAELKGHSESVTSASFSPDGKLIVTASADKTARVWDLSGKLLAELKGHQDRVNSASFSPDGKLIVTTSWDKTARVWETSGKLLVELKRHQEHINKASFSPDGKLIVTLLGNTVGVWDTTGNLVAEFTGHQSSVRSASFSPDSKLIVTLLGNAAGVWDTSGKLLAPLIGRSYINSASFSPDGKRIVTASYDGTAHVWDISGKLLAELKGHQGKVNSASFSPDGKRIVTASDDGTIRVWDTSSKLLATLELAALPSSRKAEADRLRDLEFYAPNCSAALPPWQQALNIYREISDHENEAYILEKLGNAYSCLSDYTNAIESYSQALQVAQKFNYPQQQVKNFANLGSVYNSLADYDKAIQHYNDALKLLEQNQDQKTKAEVLRGRGNAYNSLGNSNNAIQDYLQALAIDEAGKNGSGVAEDKVNLASIYQSLGDYNKAIQYYKEAYEFKPIEALTGLGNTYLALGDTAKAIDLHQQSLEKAQQQEDSEGEGNALNNLAKALRQTGKLVEAEQHLRKAIEIWENLRTNLDDASKVSIFEKQARTYRLLQEILIAQNKPEEALEIAERGRARAFVELLNSRISPDKKEQPISPPDIELLKQIAKGQKATLVQYAIISDTFKVQGKEQTKESELYIWVIKPTGDVTFRRSDLKPLWQKENLTLTEFVTISREAIGVSRGGMYDVKVVAQSQPDQTQRLQQLHNLLIKPIADVLPTDENERVIFIPHQELFLVPFGALQDESGKYLQDLRRTSTCRVGIAHPTPIHSV
jgi:tetratricopeptide (TPR) repeat protein/Tol biopolymer transport system component